MERLKKFVAENSATLFMATDRNDGTIIFDNRGFFFSLNAEERYRLIRNEPHLYVAWTDSPNGYYYVGKSNQKGGRWKRGHAYHLGTLAFHLLDTARYDDQNHQHWIDNWMNQETCQNLGNNQYSISLNWNVKIAFVPFNLYENRPWSNLPSSVIRQVNTDNERDLIKSYRNDGWVMLNVR